MANKRSRSELAGVEWHWQLWQPLVVCSLEDVPVHRPNPCRLALIGLAQLQRIPEGAGPLEDRRLQPPKVVHVES
jgi:hypothetical protein